MFSVVVVFPRHVVSRRVVLGHVLIPFIWPRLIHGVALGMFWGMLFRKRFCSLLECAKIKKTGNEFEKVGPSSGPTNTIVFHAVQCLGRFSGFLFSNTCTDTCHKFDYKLVTSLVQT